MMMLQMYRPYFAHLDLQAYLVFTKLSTSTFQITLYGVILSVLIRLLLNHCITYFVNINCFCHVIMFVTPMFQTEDNRVQIKVHQTHK